MLKPINFGNFRTECLFIHEARFPLWELEQSMAIFCLNVNCIGEGRKNPIFKNFPKVSDVKF